MIFLTFIYFTFDQAGSSLLSGLSLEWRAGPVLVAVHGLLIATASLVALPRALPRAQVQWLLLLLYLELYLEHRFSSCGARLCCPESYGILLDQGLNPCLLALADGFLTTEPAGKPDF